MISEQQKELAARFVLGELSAQDQRDFATQTLQDPELQQHVAALQTGLEKLAQSLPQVAPRPALKEKILARLHVTATPTSPALVSGLSFLPATDSGWKPLPLPGAFIKLLSLEAQRGYAVLLGKLDPGVRYPAHTNVGPEDFYILTGDLHVQGRRLGPGDFHHADAGSEHGENYSVDGCTLLAVLTVDDPLVAFAAL